MGAVNLGNIPFSVNHFIDADAAADVTYNVFRFPGEGRVLAVYAVNDATIATATNTLGIAVVSRGTTGTDTATTIANFAAATGWTADVPRTGSLTAANQDVASGTWLGIVHDETGTGVETRMAVQIDYMLATGATT